MSLFNRASRTDYLASLREKMNESSQKTFQKDDARFWKPEVDKVGTGSAVIRFLPSDPYPYVVLFTHGFQGPGGKWYIENCPTSIAGECPACVSNSALWAIGTEAAKKTASSRKRKLSYVSNILVINDPKHPENNGRVFLYKYGKKIFEKVKDLLEPPAEFDMEPCNAFDPFEGANFKLRISKVDGFPSYEKSAFDAPTALFGGNEDKIAALEGKLHSLDSILEPKEFKSYADLQKRLDSALGAKIPTSDVAEVVDDNEEAPVTKAAPKTASLKPATAKSKAIPTADEEDDDDFFAKLARQDED